MNAWIPVTKMFPKDLELVEIKFANDRVLRAKIIESEYNEDVWQTEDGKIAHLQDYTIHERLRFNIITKADVESPVAWRRIER